LLRKLAINNKKKHYFQIMYKIINYKYNKIITNKLKNLIN